MNFQYQTLPEFLKAKGVADISAKTPDEQAALYNEYNAGYKSAVTDFATKAAKQEVEAAWKGYASNIEGQFTELKSAIEKQGLAIQKMKDAGAESNGIHDPVAKGLADNLSKLIALKEGGREGFSIKAAGSMSLAGNVTGQIPQAFRLPGINDVPQREVRFLQLFTRGSISSNLVEWVYEANEDGTAGATSEGATKKQIDFDLLLGSARVEKYTAFIKVTTEMLADIPLMRTKINTKLSQKLLQSVETGSFSGNGTTPNLNGVYSVATAFSAGGFANTVDNANLVDVLRVAMNQIEVAEQPAPNYILLNSVDLLKLKLMKVSATDKRYIDALQEISSMKSLDTVPIITTNLMPAGEFLVGNTNLQYLLEREAVRVDIGLDGNDWTTNYRTILAEWRGVTYVEHNDRTAFVKGTIATAIAALETA